MNSLIKVKIKEDPYYISPQIKKVFDNSEKAVREDEQDRVFLITGKEGSGKSLLARQFAYYLDKDFSLDDICFTAEDVEKRIRGKKRYGVVILDEGNRGLSSRSALTGINKKLLSLIQEMRQLNLFFFICIPSVFLLERYLVLHRAYALFHTSIYKKDYKKRYYMVYNQRNMKDLWINGHKFMSYSRPKIHKKFRFYGKQIPSVSKEEYDAKKLESFREEPNKKAEDETTMGQRDAFHKQMTQLFYFDGKNYKKWTSALSERLLVSVGKPLTRFHLSRIARNHLKLPQIP